MTLDQAIANVEHQAAQRTVRIEAQVSSTGRKVAVELPEDASDEEIMSMASWLLGIVAPQIKARRPGARLVIPGGRS